MVSELLNSKICVVMPVYNEEACIESTLSSWRETLGKLRADYQILVLDDGSTDNTGGILDKLPQDNLAIVRKSNSGHGPTIIEGYRRAVKNAEWVFQCDSDAEIDPEHFTEFWKRRENYDFIIGARREREQNLVRKVVSAAARALINALFITRFKDVNCPFRLMRSTCLSEAMKDLPAGTFAPNVILSGQMRKLGARCLELPVVNTGRQTGEVSLKSFKIIKVSLKACYQTVAFRLKHL